MSSRELSLPVLCFGRCNFRKFIHHNATRLRCGEIFNIFIANCPQSLTVKKLKKSVSI